MLGGGIDGAGNASVLTALSVFDNTTFRSTYELHASRAGALANGWEGSTRLAFTDDAGVDPSCAALVVGIGGHAVVAWLQGTISASVYSPDAGWGAGQSFAAASSAVLASTIDSVWNAVIVWLRQSGTSHNILASRLVGSTWQGPTLVEADNTANATNPCVAFDSSGVATAVWQQSGNGNLNIYRLVQSDTSGPADSAELAVSASGPALVVWRQKAGIQSNIWAKVMR